MSEAKKFRLVHATARQNAAHAVQSAPDGWVVTLSAPKKSRDQEAKYHAMFSDIAKHVQFMGQWISGDDWKRLLVDAFARDMQAAGTPLRQGGRVVPSLDGTGVVQLGIQTRKFLKKEASDFIEFLYAWGADEGVHWSDSWGVEVAA